MAGELGTGTFQRTITFCENRMYEVSLRRCPRYTFLFSFICGKENKT
ncbi:hypothetical protein BCBMB205_32870 [Bacillus sp. CN2]|nr:hypothetical protein BCBMB205_32870 [Bacillus velezensis]ARZ59632.1 hypothetical protein BAGQ_3427 [Bacillus velezensis]GFR54705.1 hypothetical protein BCBMB205_32870 [Bacillus sp. CN2]